MLTLAQQQAEDQAGCRHEFYQEDNGRISLRADSIRLVISPGREKEVGFIRHCK
jgi:hypothetical protein